MKSQILLVILISIYSGFDLNAQKLPDSLNVFASTGLKMRTAPSVDAKVSDTIPYGAKVQVLDYNNSSPELTIKGLKGRYIKVNYKDSIAYTFSGYLSKLKPSNRRMYWQTLKDYLDKEYKKTGPSEICIRYDEANPSVGQTGTLQKYGDNLELHDFSEECEYNEELLLKNFSIQDAYLLMTTFNFNYRDAGLDNIPNLSSKEKSYAVDIKPSGHQQYYRNLTVEKDDEGEIIFIQICFDSEPGSGCVSAKKDENNPDTVSIEFTYYCD